MSVHLTKVIDRSPALSVPADSNVTALHFRKFRYSGAPNLNSSADQKALISKVLEHLSLVQGSGVMRSGSDTNDLVDWTCDYDVLGLTVLSMDMFHKLQDAGDE